MSKTIASGLDTHQQGGSTTVGYLLRLTRRDGVVIGLTSDSESLTLDGVFYDNSGLDVASVIAAAGLAVDHAEFSTLNDGEVFEVQDIQSGVWTNAAFLIGKYNIRAPSGGVEPVNAGTMGGLQILDGRVVAEFRGLQQYLQQPIGLVIGKNCAVRFGSPRCGKDLGPLTFSAAVTTAGQQVFTATALIQADDYFGNGELTWTSGANSGLTVGVKTFAAGVVGLMLPMFITVEIGDAFDIVKGCRKRLSDCKDNNNVLNFQGFPHLPGIDALTGAP